MFRRNTISRTLRIVAVLIAALPSMIIINPRPVLGTTPPIIAPYLHILQTKTGATNIPTIRAYNVSPALHPETLKNPDLLIYGYPMRPPESDRTAYARWYKAVTSNPASSDVRAIPIYHAPVKLVGNRTNTIHGVADKQATNWGGYLIIDPTHALVAADSVQARLSWTVPHVTCAGITKPGTYYSSEWVGFDGWQSKDIFQAGNEGDIECPSGKTTYYAWFECYPGPTIETKVRAYPGDQMLVSITATTRGASLKIFTLANLTTSEMRPWTQNSAACSGLSGDSMEWIVEAPQLSNGASTSLANFGHITLRGSGERQQTEDLSSEVNYYPGHSYSGTTYALSMIRNATVLVSADSLNTPIGQYFADMGVTWKHSQ